MHHMPIKRISPILLAAVGFTVVGSGIDADAAAIVDGGFETAIQTANQLDQTKVGAGWFTQSTGGWTQSSISGHSAATQVQNNYRYLAQALYDGQVTTGTATLSFEYASQDTNHDQVLVPKVYGTNSNSFSLDLSDSSNISGLTLLYENYAINNDIRSDDKTVGWTTFSADVDLGAEGYQYLVIFFSGKSHPGNASLTDYVAVDSVNLAPVPEPASLALLGLGGLVMLSRERRKGNSQ